MACRASVIPAPIFIGINSSRNPETNGLDAPVSSTGQAPQSGMTSYNTPLLAAGQFIVQVVIPGMKI